MQKQLSPATVVVVILIVVVVAAAIGYFVFLRPKEGSGDQPIDIDALDKQTNPMMGTDQGQPPLPGPEDAGPTGP